MISKHHVFLSSLCLVGNVWFWETAEVRGGVCRAPTLLIGSSSQPQEHARWLQCQSSIRGRL